MFVQFCLLYFAAELDSCVYCFSVFRLLTFALFHKVYIDCIGPSIP